MATLPYKPTDLIWLGDSRKVLSTFPRGVKRELGFGLRQVQNGLTPAVAKPLRGFGSGVYELVSNESGDTFRAVYLIKMKNGIYVLDAFQKKSKKSRKLPKEEKIRIEERLKYARKHDSE